jgi:hypothetical protein
MRKENSSEKTDLSDKIELMRMKQQETLDELTQRKIEFEREKALKSQQLQVLSRRKKTCKETCTKRCNV